MFPFKSFQIWQWIMQHVQNFAARIISGARKFDHISPVHRELSWLPPQGSGLWAGEGRNPRRDPNDPRVKKKYRIVVLLECENFLDLMKLGPHCAPG